MLHVTQCRQLWAQFSELHTEAVGTGSCRQCKVHPPYWMPLGRKVVHGNAKAQQAISSVKLQLCLTPGEYWEELWFLKLLQLLPSAAGWCGGVERRRPWPRFLPILSGEISCPEQVRGLARAVAVSIEIPELMDQKRTRLKLSKGCVRVSHGWKCHISDWGVWGHSTPSLLTN